MLPDVELATDIHINVNKIPPWVAEELAACLHRSVRDYFSVPENQAKYEEWLAERDQRQKTAQEGEK